MSLVFRFPLCYGSHTQSHHDHAQISYILNKYDRSDPTTLKPVPVITGYVEKHRQAEYHLFNVAATTLG